MNIGTEQPVYVIEPIEDPVPGRRPAPAPPERQEEREPEPVADPVSV